MTNGRCCIVPQEMVLFRITFIQSAMSFKYIDNIQSQTEFLYLWWVYLVACDCSNDYKSDPFIFSLTNKDNKQLKMKIHPNKDRYAIYCHSILGPTFGDDISINDNPNTTMDSCSQLSDCYKHPLYAFRTNGAQTFLAGSFKFQLEEIEVYQKE